MIAIGEQSLRWLAAAEDEASVDPAGHVAEHEAGRVADVVAELVATYSGLLYRVALSILRNAAEAEDVVQESFLRVVQQQVQQQGKLGGIVDMRPWLVRIAWNLALDRRRRMRPEQMDEVFAASLVSASLPADVALAEAATMREVLAAIERLPAKEREALLLSAMEELSTAEIANVLGRSESSVRSLIFRARSKLRGRLKD